MCVALSVRAATFDELIKLLLNGIAVTAVIGAVILLWIVGMIKKK